jgi:hypothetical protein
MRTSTLVPCITLLASLVSSVSLTAAQAGDAAPAPLPAYALPVTAAHLAAPVLDDGNAERRAAELAEWTRAFAEWQEWSARWLNRRERGWLTSSRERRDAPPPPAWLGEQCGGGVAATHPLAHACELVAEWRSDPLTTQLRQARAAAQADAEDAARTTFWERVHLDVLWPAMQLRTSTYGVIGLHTALPVGRVQLFVAPGVMLMNLPSRSGARAWKVAANYGVGYRLADFAFPGLDRMASLHVNAARAWLLSDVADVVAGRTVDFAGFSITFQKRR